MATQSLEVLDGYLSLNDTMAALGASTATIERMVRSKRLASKLVPRAKRKPERVYSAEDVERLKREKEQRREARPPSAQAASALAVRPKTPNQEWFELFREMFDERQIAAAPQAPKPLRPWITAEEAAEASGLAPSHLVRLGKAGQIVMLKSGRQRVFLRASVEAFEG